MPQKIGQFDAMGFYEAIDSTRQSRGLTWRKVAEEAGVPASTLTRMAQGRRPDVDSLATLAAWSGLRPDDYVRSKDRRPAPEPLAMVSTYLRSDPNLTEEAAVALSALIKAAYGQLRTEGSKVRARRPRGHPA